MYVRRRTCLRVKGGNMWECAKRERSGWSCPSLYIIVQNACVPASRSFGFAGWSKSGATLSSTSVVDGESESSYSSLTTFWCMVRVGRVGRIEERVEERGVRRGEGRSRSDSGISCMHRCIWERHTELDRGSDTIATPSSSTTSRTVVI